MAWPKLQGQETPPPKVLRENIEGHRRRKRVREVQAPSRSVSSGGAGAGDWRGVERARMVASQQSGGGGLGIDHPRDGRQVTLLTLSSTSNLTFMRLYIVLHWY